MTRDFQNGRLAAATQLGRVGQFRGDIERDDHGAVTIGMNEVAGAHRHSGHANFAAKTISVDIGMRRTDGARKGLEAWRPLRNVADRPIRDDAEATERLVDRALNFAPERAEPGIGAVDILNNADARALSGADIFVIGKAPRLLFGCRKAGRGSRADRRGSRKADHRRQIRKRTHQRLRRIADKTPRRRDDLQRVADRRRIMARQGFEEHSRQRCGVRHERFLQISWAGQIVKAAH